MEGGTFPDEDGTISPPGDGSRRVTEAADAAV
jgi:hypothetical protein